MLTDFESRHENGSAPISAALRTIDVISELKRLLIIDLREFMTDFVLDE